MAKSKYKLNNLGLLAVFMLVVMVFMMYSGTSGNSAMFGAPVMGVGAQPAAPVVRPLAANAEVICSDGLDNDKNGLKDCADPACNAKVCGTTTCQAGTIGSCSKLCAQNKCANCIPVCKESDCDNKIDDDKDGGLIDCKDPDCNGIDSCEFNKELTCNDGIDNDGDRLTDCLDIDCNRVGICEFGKELTCSDAKDNDADAKTDCADLDCLNVIKETCNDNTDNDCDGNIDCKDADCNALICGGTTSCNSGASGSCDNVCANNVCGCTPVCKETTCNDEIDNDGGDGADCADADCNAKACKGTTACGEGTTGTACNNACANNACSCAPTCKESACSDSTDNDADGKIDCADSDCSSDSACLPDLIPSGATKTSFTNDTGTYYKYSTTFKVTNANINVDSMRTDVYFPELYNWQVFVCLNSGNIVAETIVKCENSRTENVAKVKIVTDANNIVTESNENNNIAT